MKRMQRTNTEERFSLFFGALCFIAYLHFNSKKRKEGKRDDTSRFAEDIGKINVRQARDYEKLNRLVEDVERIWLHIDKETDHYIELNKVLAEIKAVIK